MQGSEVFSVLQSIEATHLYHANSVTTSCTFLEQGGLTSRGFVEDNGLTQTPQTSDAIDKRFGIWHCIFFDHVDIHDRANRRNSYGPVLFVLDLEVLLSLPADSNVLVSRKNPTNWVNGEPDTERWFRSEAELTGNMSFGDFGKMLLIQTPSSKLDFPDGDARIVLDNPQKQVSNGDDAYAYAETRLTQAATTRRVQAAITPRDCGNNCRCVENYSLWGAQKVDRYFK